MYRGTFNEDTLLAEVWTQTGAYLQAGRYLFALLWEVTYRLGLDMGHMSGMNVIVSVVLLAFAVTLITEGLSEIINEKKDTGSIKGFLCLDSVVLITFLNLIGMELLFFSAYALVVGLAGIFVALAIKDYASHHRIRCYLFLTLAILVYQAYVGVFIIFALLSLYLENDGKLNKDNFIRSAIVVVVSGILCLIDIYSIKILEFLKITTAMKNIKSFRLSDIFKTIFETQISILKNEYSLSFIKFLPFILLLSAGIVILIGMIHRRASLNEWIYLFLLFVVSNLSVFAVTFGGYLYMAPRILVSYWAFISMSLIVALYLNNNQRVNIFLLLLVNIVTFLHIINANVLITDLYISNRLDQNYVMTVNQMITKYEEASGTKIERIGFCTDEKVQQYWKEYIDYYNFNMNERCTDQDWTFDLVLKRFTGRSYEKIKVPDDVFKEYFAGKDWDYFDAEEQMIFDGDTLYLAIY
ncbi:MAG: glucosyltransferase domain-containing protein [Lachnospiraceae bacterium]